MRPLTAILGLAACCALTACSSEPAPPKPRVANLTLVGSADLNPNLDSQPSPLIIQIVELRGPVEFAAAPFDSLKRDPSGALGQSLVRTRPRLTLLPGSEKVESFELDAATTQIGVFGFFSGEPGGEEMRKFVFPAEAAVAGARVQFSGYTIRLAP